MRVARGYPGPPHTVTVYGHIKSLRRHGRWYVLRFDPAWFLDGKTAQRAAVEDGAIPRGDVVTNDYYIREGGHSLLTFFVPGNAKVRMATAAGMTPIPVFELSRVVAGGRPKRRFVDVKLGFWAYVTRDVVRRLDQQYQPEG